MSPATRIHSLLATSFAVFLLCFAPSRLSAASSDPVVTQLQADVVALRNRVLQLESANAQIARSAVAVTPGELALRVKQLGDQVAAISGAVSVGPTGVTIRGPNIALDAAQNISISAALNAQVKATTLQLQSVTLSASGTSQARIDGGMLLLNGGGRPILTIGSQVGSPTVLAP